MTGQRRAALQKSRPGDRCAAKKRKRRRKRTEEGSAGRGEARGGAGGLWEVSDLACTRACPPSCPAVVAQPQDVGAVHAECPDREDIPAEDSNRGPLLFCTSSE